MSDAHESENNVESLLTIHTECVHIIVFVLSHFISHFRLFTREKIALQHFPIRRNFHFLIISGTNIEDIKCAPQPITFSCILQTNGLHFYPEFCYLKKISYYIFPFFSKRTKIWAGFLFQFVFHLHFIFLSFWFYYFSYTVTNRFPVSSTQPSKMYTNIPRTIMIAKMFLLIV